MEEEQKLTKAEKWKVARNVVLIIVVIIFLSWVVIKITNHWVKYGELF